MIVYGDHERCIEPGAFVAELRGGWSALRGGGDAATDLLVETGRLAQGLIDAAFAARGEIDDFGELEARCAAVTIAAGRVLVCGADVAEVVRSLDELPAGAMPGRITLRQPEGYAFYALYPQLYAEAARRLKARWGGGTLTVIGLRSIGTSLAGVVAAALDVSSDAVTLRPRGHPFARRVRVGAALERRFMEGGGARRYVIVDEGPGLSGSSINSVADYLEAHGVALERIAVLPGHGGELGPHASAAHRRRWASVTRIVVGFEEWAGGGGGWGRGGAMDASLDVGAGRWRGLVYGNAGRYPPVNAGQERRKFLMNLDGRRWLAKFAGLGAAGRKLLERSRLLAAAGVAPGGAELERGFLVRPWLEGARPLDMAGCERGLLVETLGRYLAALWYEHEAEADESGADAATLLEMARVNTAEGLGERAAKAVEAWRGHLERITPEVRRVRTDNRIHAWEWLVTADGRIVKSDALEHHASHDCIGVQDLAWDLAGAGVELGLSTAEELALEAQLRGAGVRLAGATVRRFHRTCYLAYQMGYYALHAESAAAEEAMRMRRRSRWYARLLRASLCDPLGGA